VINLYPVVLPFCNMDEYKRWRFPACSCPIVATQGALTCEGKRRMRIIPHHSPEGTLPLCHSAPCTHDCTSTTTKAVDFSPALQSLQVVDFGPALQSPLPPPYPFLRRGSLLDDGTAGSPTSPLICRPQLCRTCLTAPSQRHGGANKVWYAVVSLGVPVVTCC